MHHWHVFKRGEHNDLTTFKSEFYQITAYSSEYGEKFLQLAPNSTVSDNDCIEAMVI